MGMCVLWEVRGIRSGAKHKSVCNGAHGVVRIAVTQHECAVRVPVVCAVASRVSVPSCRLALLLHESRTTVMSALRRPAG